MNAMDTVIAGRVRLIFSSVFFGTIATHMRLVETKHVPTMGVDGVSLFFNPEFVKKLSKAEVEFVLAHEVLHLVLLTHLRRGSRDKELWNVATDYAINLLLKDEKFTVMDGCLINEKYRDWSAEKIYNYLQENPDEQPEMGGGWNVGAVMDGGTGGEEGKEDSQAPMTQSQIEVEVGNMKAKTQAAAIAGRKAGQFSAGMDRLIDKVCKPRANWKVILQRFVNERCYNDWNYSQCHTRMLHQYGVVSPVLDGEKLGRLALMVDTSGSVDDDQLSQFAGEISDILDQFPCEVTVIYIDTKINREPETFTQDDLPLQLRAVGGGGTLARLGYEYVAEHLTDARAIIHYTDSFLADWGQIEQPSIPVIVACTEKRVARDIPEWAEIIDISE